MSIIQGSGLGTTLYIILEGDLKPISAINTNFRYASLMVPENTVCLLQEFDNFKKWTEINKSFVGLTNISTLHLQLLDSVERDNEAKLLGVFSVITYILKLILTLF